MLPRLSLHPEHINSCTMSAIPWCGQATSEFTMPEDEELVVDWADPSCLSVKSCSDDLESIMDVDLILAEVKHDWDSDRNQNVIIVKPWCEAEEQNPQIIEISLNRLKSCVTTPAGRSKPLLTINLDQVPDDECEAPEFWIFLVTGDAASVRAALRRMGEGGALRYKPFEFLVLGPHIGAGGNANVYRCTHCDPNDVNDAGCKDKIVFKVLHRSPDCATALEELDAIQHEITLVIHVGRHPNIVKFLGAFCLEAEAVVTASASFQSYDVLSKDSPNGLLPRWALISEYLPGGDVFDAVHKQRFKEPRARQIMADLLSALTHIHRHGIVHRDVKVENLLLPRMVELS